jgi:hypothetical protein
MENQPCFALNDALLRWRRELAGQRGITEEDIRELETHLLESFSAFQRQGLSGEEALAKAREKLGSASQLGAEFAKTHLLTIWRDGVKKRIIRRMKIANLAAVVATTMMLLCLMWCFWALSRQPKQDAELSRIEALIDPLDWKASALSLTMSRHETARRCCQGGTRALV